jgi:hypothetical protein
VDAHQFEVVAHLGQSRDVSLAEATAFSFELLLESLASFSHIRSQ